MVERFNFSRTPYIIFGNGRFEELPGLAAGYGRNMLLLTGSSSLQKSGYYSRLTEPLEKRGINFDEARIEGEPSPDIVDDISNRFRDKKPDVVVAIGGGSVLDAGKAVSAMLPAEESVSVMTYIEGVGAGKEHSGEKVPYIAVPTTSGTGSEATNNAVLSRIGEGGFKKSLRHDSFIPDIALIDPELCLSCPPKVTAASGLDAISQLLGAYLSTEASVLTDSIVERALELAGRNFIPACTTGSTDPEVRAGMAYASLMSGIALTSAGLGIIHGLASPVGARVSIPHGVVCGTLLGEAVRLNIELLEGEGKAGRKYLRKYARSVALLTGEGDARINESEVEDYCRLLINTIEDWLGQVSMPRLGEYGLGEGDLEAIAEKSGSKNNPAELSRDQIKQLVRCRI